MINDKENINDSKREEHKLLENAWIAIGPQGLAAAAVASIAIGSSNGWLNAALAFAAALAGASIWMFIMKCLMKDRPDGFRKYKNQ
jgi:hypothetical protein